MSPQMSAYVTVVFLLIGAVAVWIMLDIQGNPKKKVDRKTLTRVHRILGYLFIMIYVIMCVLMIRKANNYHQAFPVRIATHMVLAICLAPMILLKIGIAKRFKRFFNYLPVFGSVIFIFAFTLSAITAGYFFLHQSKIEYTSVSESDKKFLDKDISRTILFTKCSKCHSLEPVLRASKSSAAWEKTVNRMAKKDVPNIRPFDVKQILFYLMKRKESKRQQLAKAPGKFDLTGEELVQSKCTNCHKLDRVHSKSGDQDYWEKIIERMIENADEIGLIDFLTDKEKEDIVDFLASQN